MARQTSRYTTPLAVTACTALIWLFPACENNMVVAETREAGAMSFVDPDADTDVADAAASSTLYCPTSECAFGYATCAGSQFLCETNLLGDPNNCGACGNVCPHDTDNASFVCIEGVCSMLCKDYPKHFDCDGIIDNGCEVWPTTDEHCGACNVKCDTSTDPSKGCVNHFDNGGWSFQCGCPDGLLRCDTCVDSKSDDMNCGGCWNACAPNGGPQPTPPNGYYGCADEQCGSFKCNQLYLDCDGERENGCEVMAVDDEHCGACGAKCAAGTRCVLDPNNVPTCMCDPGTTLCVTGSDPRGFESGYCAAFENDNDNCGGCGVKCATGTPWFLPFPGAREYCVGGSCELRCVEGFADCNHGPADGCETNTMSDPRNCGGCGIECDMAAGQACSGGRCMVAPCDPDEVETAR